MKSIVFVATVLRIIIITALLGLTIFANAQSVAVNTTGTSAHASAMLDVSSTSKGFLPPRLTTIQRTGISSPAMGLIVFDTDTKTYWYYSQAWKEITNTGGSGFALPYTGTYADAGKTFAVNNTAVNDGAAAVYGKIGNTGSGFNPAFSIGVWGDNAAGPGIAGSSSTQHGVYGFTNGNQTAGVYGKSGSNGYGVMGYATTGIGLYGLNQGTSGKAAAFEATNPVNPDPAVIISNYGTNSGLVVNAENANSSSFLIEGAQYGLGGGINLLLANPNANYEALNILHQGNGTGVSVTAEKGYAVSLANNSTSTSSLLMASNLGMGNAASFINSNSSNNTSVLTVLTHGTGAAMVINNSNVNSVSSLATFQKNNINKARIDGNGKGFFNGGTQSSGADVAEAFDVTGNRNEYEPGDVLVISVSEDRTVEKSSMPYSTLVAGVFATKPGVLLTEEDIETDISDKVPMGVVGVIPTKVCLEGGEIKRGALLVTSSISGVAMKADIEKIKPGQVIGKALENYSASSVGKIKVLVNVK